MFEIKIFETANGNRPFEKYVEKLSKKHKTDEVTEIFTYIKKLEAYGFQITKMFKPDAIKHIKDDIYELRPTSSRIFFFYYDKGAFIILHGWEKKRNETDPKEIKKAIREKNEYLGGARNERINKF